MSWMLKIYHKNPCLRYSPLAVNYFMLTYLSSEFYFFKLDVSLSFVVIVFLLHVSVGAANIASVKCKLICFVAAVCC